MVKVSRFNRFLNFFNRVWAIGRTNYIRFYPNPGIRLVRNGEEYKWDRANRYRKGRVR